MNPSLIDWYRAVHISPGPDVLERRGKAIDKVVEELDVQTAFWLVHALTSSVHSGATPAIGQLSNAFHAEDPTFSVREGITAELRVLCGAVLVEFLCKSDKPSWAGAVAAGIVTSDFGGRRRAEGTADFVELAREHVRTRSQQVRTLPQYEELPASKFGETTKGWDQAVGENTVTKIAPILKTVLTTLDSDLQTARRAIRRHEQAFKVQQEETNILWWLLNGRTRVTATPFRDLASQAAPLLIAKDLSDLTEFLPGVLAAEGFIAEALRHSQDASEITIQQAVDATPMEWRTTLTTELGKARLDLCPVLSAIKHSTDLEGSAWTAVYERNLGKFSGHAVSRLELAAQTYRECLFARSTVSK